MEKDFTIEQKKERFYTLRRLWLSVLEIGIQDSMTNFYEFVTFINSDTYVNNIIINKTKDIDVDFSKHFIENGIPYKMNLPINENELIKVIYDYANSILEHKRKLSDIVVFNMDYRRKYGDGNRVVKQYTKDAFGTLVDYILRSVYEDINEIKVG